MSLEARINLVTLGVADIAAATEFYQAFGWRKSESQSNENISFFQLDNLVLALFGLKALAKDAGIKNIPSVPGPVTLAINMASEADVDRFLDNVVKIGGTLVKPAEKTFWGGYSGYFADPDGHRWEIAHNPFFPLDKNGLIRLPD
ncbi:MAG: VOC family protein [Fimbriimonadaceae bacterium]|nr:VOC family protein [Alphaproteobacteria bacterium]